MDWELRVFYTALAVTALSLLWSDTPLRRIVAVACGVIMVITGGIAIFRLVNRKE